MGITAITVYDSNGTKIGTLTGKIGIKPGTGCTLSFTLDNHAQLKADRLSTDLLEQAMQQFKATYRYITEINELPGSETGDFTIGGSACFGWLIPAYDATTNPAIPGNINTAIRVFPKEQSTSSDPTAVSIYSSANGGALRLYDVCPSCSSCDTLFKLRTQIEYMKEMLNAFKDSSLYPTTGTQTATSYNSRQTWLHSKRMPAQSGTSCPVDPAYSGTGADVVVRNNILLGQYAATVHMWNYAVSQNNTSTDLNPINGDTSGFSVQVKRAFPNCGPGKSIHCTVDIIPSQVESDLSVYITDPKFEFRPFQAVPSTLGGSGTLDETLSTQAQSSTGQGWYIQTYAPSATTVTYALTNVTFDVTAGNIPYCTFDTPSNYRFKSGDTISWGAGDIPIASYKSDSTSGVATLILPTGTIFPPVGIDTATISQSSSNSQTRKTVYANAISVPYAGTYVLTFKFLPFIYGRLMTRSSAGGWVPLDISDDSSSFWNDVASTSVDEQDAQGVVVATTTTYYLEAILDTTGGPLENPSLTDYNNSRMYPSKSTSRLNKWQVDVTWQIEIAQDGGGQPIIQTYTETYYFQTSGVRRFINGLMRESLFTTAIETPEDPDKPTTTTPSQGTGTEEPPAPPSNNP